MQTHHREASWLPGNALTSSFGAEGGTGDTPSAKRLQDDCQGAVFVEYLVVLVLVSIVSMVPLMMLAAAMVNYFKANRIALTIPLL